VGEADLRENIEDLQAWRSLRLGSLAQPSRAYGARTTGVNGKYIMGK
jgi:hypothetical protein